MLNFDISEETAALVLHLLPGLTQAAARELYRMKGSARAVLAEADTLPPKARAALGNAGALQQALERARAEVDFCRENRIAVLPLNAPDYPARLAECKDAPLLLFYRGSAGLNARHVLSVVGTRRITEYGKRLCRELAADLKRLMPDTVVVSGLAYGVDIHTHRAALEAGLDTVGVLAHGLDRIYPSLHRATAAEMTAHGGLLTEYLTGTNPDKGNFVRRNRIVAGIADGTIVVESADKGGALITAHLAFDYDREVMAFPGRTSDACSAGCNKLIRTATAQLVTCGQDIMDCLMWQVPKPGDSEPQQLRLFPEFTADEERILNALDANEARNLSRLMADTGIPIGVLTATLVQMEIKGWVRKGNGHTFLLNF